MISSTSETALYNYILQLADDKLVLGHRLSEWCGHGPVLEEDIALTNIALDMVGQATALLDLAGKVEGRERSADDLAYFREAREFKNCLLVEEPRGDFAYTIAKLFIFNAFNYLLYTELKKSKFEPLAALADKSLKETLYHLRHSREWILRLGDGTEESKSRISEALSDLWIFTGELFMASDVEALLIPTGVAPNPSDLKAKWEELVSGVLKEATLSMPDSKRHMRDGGRRGLHSEHLGLMLAEMQILPRSYPDARW